MNTIVTFIDSLTYAFRFIFKNGTILFFLPSVIFTLLFYVFVASGSWITRGVNFMEDWVIIGWLIDAISSIFKSISFFIFEFIVLILLSPINGILAEKAKADLTGIQTSFSFSFLIKSLKRMLIIVGVALLIQFSITVVLWIVSFIFGNWFYTIASLINLSFFVGFSFFDFSLELDLKSLKESWLFARKNALKCILIGLVFVLFIHFPYQQNWLGLYLIGIAFIPHLLVLATTKLYYLKQ